MDGFSKIDLDAPTPSHSQQPTDQINRTVCMKKRKKINLGRAGIIIAGVVVFLLLFSIFGIVLPAQKVYKDAKTTYATAKLALATLKQEDIAASSDQLNAAKPQLLQTQKDLQGMWYLHFIPLANWYYDDATHLTQAGVYGLNAGQIMVDAIKPYADVLGLHGAGSFTGGTAQDRIQTAVTTMSKITPQIDAIGAQLALVQKEMDQVDPNHYPALLGGKNIQDQLKAVRLGVDEAATFVSQAKPLIK